jgi:hypothetical protein
MCWIFIQYSPFYICQLHLCIHKASITACQFHTTCQSLKLVLFEPKTDKQSKKEFKWTKPTLWFFYSLIFLIQYFYNFMSVHRKSFSFFLTRPTQQSRRKIVYLSIESPNSPIYIHWSFNWWSFSVQVCRKHKCWFTNGNNRKIYENGHNQME